ncbi:hypothetical protein QBC45DRAFT_487862 [Copromyces sp. CBS 386.78]|nr:hypothetical protein QBC45DRAFT_487862 [Copromyces sp. CBS 386.78]
MMALQHCTAGESSFLSNIEVALSLTVPSFHLMMISNLQLHHWPWSVGNSRSTTNQSEECNYPAVESVGGLYNCIDNTFLFHSLLRVGSFQVCDCCFNESSKVSNVSTNLTLTSRPHISVRGTSQYYPHSFNIRQAEGLLVTRESIQIGSAWNIPGGNFTRLFFCPLTDLPTGPVDCAQKQQHSSSSTQQSLQQPSSICHLPSHLIPASSIRQPASHSGNLRARSSSIQLG